MLENTRAINLCSIQLINSIFYKVTLLFLIKLEIIDHNNK